MTGQSEEVAGLLSSRDADMIAGAWQGQSGRWYIDGLCKHLWAYDICSLSGVLTPLGLAVRSHLLGEREGA